MSPTRPAPRSTSGTAPHRAGRAAPFARTRAARARPRGPVAALVLGLPLLASCGDATAPDTTGLVVTTERSVYALPDEGPAVVAFRVENRGVSTAYVEVCGGALTAVVEREADGAWTDHDSLGYCLAIYPRTPVPLAPGEHIDRSARVRPAGRYRIRVAVAAEPDRDWKWQRSAPVRVE